MDVNSALKVIVGEMYRMNSKLEHLINLMEDFPNKHCMPPQSRRDLVHSPQHSPELVQSPQHSPELAQSPGATSEASTELYSSDSDSEVQFLGYQPCTSSNNMDSM